MRHQRSTAGPLVAAYLLLVVYASLYPFAGWRWPAGQGIEALLTLPWPPWRHRFDEIANLLGYAPLGALVFAAIARSGGSIRMALAVGSAVPSALSFLMEVAQNFIPQRYPSLRDWTANTLGAAAGVGAAWLLQSLGLFDRWQRLRERWFVRDSAGAIALLLLWPVGLLFPSPVPLGTGQIFPELRALTESVLAGTPLAQSLPAWFGPEPAASTTLPVATEGVTIALGMLAPCLLAAVVTRSAWLRVLGPIVAAALALGAMTLSTALNFGPEHALAWLTPAALPAMGVATVLAIALAPMGARTTAALGLVVLAALVALVAGAPADPYYAASLQAWEAGRFIRFHGLAYWVGLLWPYFSMAWLVVRLARRD